MGCAGCGREMQDGDLCIKGTPSQVTGLPTDAFLDKLAASVLGGDRTLETDVLVYCLDCTEHGGGFEIEVYRAEEGGGDETH